MSIIVDVARGIMAIIQPETGDRATGTVKIVATSSDVTVDRNKFIVPIVGGRHRPDLVFKVARGPESDRSWTVTSSGVDVSVLSNIGGARHNLPMATEFVFDPPLDGIDSVVPTAAMANGTDPTGFGGIQNMVLYEQFEGPSAMLDLARSAVRAFPAVLVAWTGSEPGDGASSSQVDQRIRTGSFASLNREMFDIVVITNRGESDHIRRQEGLSVLDQITMRLAHRRGVDGGQPVSNPSGLQIRGRYRENGPQDIYKKFYVYGLRVSAMIAYTQIDERTPAQWLLAKFDVLKPQDPALPNQGDYTVVEDAEVDMYDP
jgi:hypothetical protein